MIGRFVLDAWAILAFLQQEMPASSQVRQRLLAANEGDIELAMSLINLGEVYYRIGKTRGQEVAETTLAKLIRLPIQYLSVSDEIVMTAARAKVQYTVSYADAFAVATTTDLDATLITGDPELIELSDVLRIEKLHREN